MIEQPTRRGFVASISTLLIAGCSSNGTESPAGDAGGNDGTLPGGGSSGTTTASPTPNDGQMTPTDDGTPDPADEIERLPEPSPLATTLVEFLQTEDRRAFADDRGIPFEDGRVHVQVELVEGGELPVSLVDEVTTAYDPIRNAWIPVANLVDVALDDDVRIVRPIPEARTH